MPENPTIREETRHRTPGKFTFPARLSAHIVLLVLVFALLGAASCSKQATPTTLPNAKPTATATDLPQPTEPAVSASPTPGSSQISLRVWIPPEFAITADSLTFSEIVTGFEAAYPGIRIELSAKRAIGKGGLLDMLQGAAKVAPGYLPDLILMDHAETALAIERGLLQAMDPLLASPAGEHVFASILVSGTSNGTRYGLPFALDFLHLAYRTSITSSFPLNWTTVLDSDGRHLFASGGSENYSSDAILIQYLGVDGSLKDAEGKPAMDSRLLTRVLDAYKQMSDEGTLAAESLRLNSPDGVWDMYKAGEADFAEVWASQFKAEALSIPDTSFGRIPTRNGRAIVLAHVWVWSIPARTPERQQAAASFLDWVTAPSRQRAWCEAALLLPAGPGAWPLPRVSIEYSLFLMHLAEEATPFPVGFRSAMVSAALQEALAQVIAGSASPKQAAEQAIVKMKLQ